MEMSACTYRMLYVRQVSQRSMASEIPRSPRSWSSGRSSTRAYADMRLSTCLILAWLFFAFLTSPWPCLANEEGAAPFSELVVEPDTIKIPRFGQDAITEVTVIARTTGAASLPADVDLSFVASPGLELTLGEQLAGAGDIAWPVRVRVTGDAPDESAIDFRLAYSIAAKGSGSDPAAMPIVQLQRARLAVMVEPERSASPTEDAEISIKTDDIAITESASLRVYLLIRNKSNYPFTVETPVIHHPKFLTVTNIQKRASVGAHDTLQVPLDMEIAKGEKPQIGEWLILASVTLTRGEGKFERTGVAVVEQKIKVGVPGVSDVLQALDLPSLLLVPGALVLATWSLLFGAAQTGKFTWLEWKSSSFWLVSITVSIIIFGALSQLRIGPDFLVAFSVRDVAWLWLGCVAGGGITFALYRGGEKGLAGYRAARAETQRRAREPLQSDKPIDILRKLERTNLPFYLPSYTRTLAGQEQQIFELGFPAPEGRAWIIPKIILRPQSEDEAVKRLVAQISASNNRPSDGRAELVAAVEKALQQNWIRLDWEAGELSRPETLPADQLGNAGSKKSPIDVD